MRFKVVKMSLKVGKNTFEREWAEAKVIARQPVAKTG